MSSTDEISSVDCNANYLRSKILALLRKRLHHVQSAYHEDLVELNFIQSGSQLIDFYQWRKQKTQELMQALCSGHLDPEDLASISSYISGHIPTDVFFPPNGIQANEANRGSEIEQDSEEEEERGLDETSIYRLAYEEVNVLKRVVELKKAGLWLPGEELPNITESGISESTPSMSALAPPPEPTTKTFNDYLLAESRWLAEDYKRERQWKRVSAKRIALTALKSFRDRGERSLKLEREENLRIRKMCSVVAKMIRDWWRQMDKIVHAKQQVRLSAKRQQAISTHLGRVLETTEEYTRWLTEDIAGAKSGFDGTGSISDTSRPLSTTSREHRNRSSSRAGDVKTSDASELSDSSDNEFAADEAELEHAEDDEETIEEEERRALAGDPGSIMSPNREIAELMAEADKPIEDLIPPDYFNQTANPLDETITNSPVALSRTDEENNKSGRQSDASFEAESSDESDDETTIDAQERYERQMRRKSLASVDDNDNKNDDQDLPETNTDEINQLELEANMPLDVLLNRLMSSAAASTTATNEGEVSEMNDNPDTEEESESDTSSTNDDSSSSGQDSDDEAHSSSSSDDDSDISLRNLLVDRETNESTTPKHPEEHLTSTSCTASCQSTQIEPGIGKVQSENEKNLESITSEALSAQPSSSTLQNESSIIATPFLLKGGSLREYQVVGLSWLAAIYDKRLNGILADEMGLGKTIQTIALLAYLACERGVWGPHLIVVPTSVILNWEIEFKRWCPGFKILTYFGSLRERKEKRKGWTKTNAFHVCITSYRLAIQDSVAFKRKKWKYLILDEAQNIKNFKSQRWQTLLTFNSQRRLLLTGTPLQNSLMELWSLMHFLMPNIFQSHRDFQEWFASPLTGMIEGNSEYNEMLVQRLHKVLRPFLLRRLKSDVERQMPKKFEHVIMCRLSRRQRFLYDEFMSLSSTRETLKSGQFLSVMNILMQLRKVCNHPNLFETRPITSPFRVADSYLTYSIPKLISSISHSFLVLAPSPNGSSFPVGMASGFCEPDLDWLDKAGAAARLLGQTMNLAEMARDLPGFVRTRCRQLSCNAKLITLVDTMELEDDVQAQRLKLPPYSNTNSLPMSDDEDDVYTSFISPNDAMKVSEHLRKSYNGCLPYPSLPPAAPITPTIMEVPPPSRPWNNGMPKSCLRLRQTERQNRLSLMGRINERRCGFPIASPNPSTKSQSDFQWGSNTHIGPDLVYCLTRMLREPSLSDSFTRHHVYPGQVDGSINCCRSQSWWPNRRLEVIHKDTSRIEQASGFFGHSRRVRLGPEYYPSERWLWTRDCTTLRQLLYSPMDYLEELQDILPRFTFAVPPVISSGFTLQISSHNYERQLNTQSSRIQDLMASSCLPSACLPPSSTSRSMVHRAKHTVSNAPLSPLAWLMPMQLHQISTACRIQFPDPRLIQYDCGKLQRLDLLLRELKSNNHRVLIFTQMSRMLDILEQFLAYHGHHYLRLDGTTKVEQRQVLMERFNQDTHIFVFILSTRSGGLGVNLTGADTVIFYDSDWNPTMDAQAQDRCHRIGQTRDVHIYRLISERTVEENILRKANQKRFLSDVAIEGGRFTTAFFKQNTLTELFAEPSGLQDLVAEKEKIEKVTTSSFNSALEPTPEAECIQQEHIANSNENTKPIVLTTRSGRQIRSQADPSVLAALMPAQNPQDKIQTLPSVNSETQLAALLEACEEEHDRVAAKRALDEAKADLAEFDETIPLEVNTSSTATVTGVVNNITQPESSIESNEVDALTRFALKKQMNRTQDPNMSATSEPAAIEPQPVEETAEQAVERELAQFESELRPIERFGVRLMEDVRGDVLIGQLELADAEFMESKETWRLEQLKALYEADEQRADLEEDEMLYCYGDYDPVAQIAKLERAERMKFAEKPKPKSIKSSTTTKSNNFLTRKSNDQISDKSTSDKNSVLTKKTVRVDDNSSLMDKTGGGKVKNTRAVISSDILENSTDTFDSVPTQSSKHMRPIAPFKINQTQTPKSSNQDSALPRIKKRPNRSLEETPVSELRIKKLPRLDETTLSTDSNDMFYSRNRKSVLDIMNEVSLNGLNFEQSDLISSPRVNSHIQSRYATTQPSIMSRGKQRPHPFAVHATVSRSNELQPPSKMFRPDLSINSPHRSSPSFGIVSEEPIESSDMSEFSLPASTSSFGGPKSQGYIYDPSRVPIELDLGRPPSSSSMSSSVSDMFPRNGRSAYNHQFQPGDYGSTLTFNKIASPSKGPRQVKSNTATTQLRTHSNKPSEYCPPVSAQRPPEPLIPVHSAFNGVHVSLPAGQLLTPTGQPVFVITRQMKTPTGEVYHQRFTHPVVPPPQFTKMVLRLNPPSTGLPQVYKQAAHVRPDSINLPVSTRDTSAPEPIIQSRAAPVVATSAGSNRELAASSPSPGDLTPKPLTKTAVLPLKPTPDTNIKTTMNIPIIRMITCDTAKINPVIRLVPSEADASAVPGAMATDHVQSVQTKSALTPVNLQPRTTQQQTHFATVIAANAGAQSPIVLRAPGPQTQIIRLQRVPLASVSKPHKH